ncbi:sialidase family protein [Clostridium felsineum]|uniref:sialidase family protein n=1 Tax=Clostridium felsineum TaxID=36839 RepID=UPI00098C562D|nr:sialidase family protein [Clostridium felsineum]URZ18470.1 hypothetical protein CLFE_045580 [Clostridium felsineum DSM 794]
MRKKTLAILIMSFAVAFSTFSINTKAQDAPFSVKPGLFDQTKPDNLGLNTAKGAETVTVFHPSASTNKYSNCVVMTAFKGYLYCQWQSSEKDEDAPDTSVVYSRSKDGINWSSPIKLASPTSNSYCTTGGFLVHKNKLIAYVNVWPSNVSPKGGFSYYASSTDGINWSKLKPVKMADGSHMQGILEQDPHVLKNGRIINAAHFKPGLIAAPIYTDDASGIRGWTRAKFTNLPYTGASSRELEPSLFVRKDGAVVMVFRDQAGTYRRLASVSLDNGKTWSTPVVTDMPDSRAKQSAGNLPDGTAYMVGNPVNSKIRIPLAITLSKDGKNFNKAYVLRQGGTDLQPQQYTGKYKTLGYSYPKSMVYNGYLYVSYSTNKEDVQFTRIPLSSLSLNGHK